ncbi:MAG: acyl-CoA/acyl-ACP dehydrogenase [Proteobacteria bacterium]|nr:acyl-CoA/acyl-ACP dehydrogenase [Pseudomonadota bacterium]
MDFSFSDEQKDLRELARQILEDKVSNERLKQVEAQDEVFDADLWQELARSNLLGAALPEAFGGTGFGYFELCLLLQEIGRTVAPVPVYASLVLGALPLAEFGSDAQKREWLPRVVDGSAVLSAGLVELEADDPMDPATTAKRDGDGWRLEGRKSLVPAGLRAARILVPARSDDGRIGVFLVDPESAGVERTSQQCTDRQPYCQLALSGTAVTERDLVGDLDRGSEILAWLLDRATVGLCAVQLGVSERALEMTAAYTSERRQFDRPVGSFQAVHQRAADAYVNVEAMRLTTWETAWRLAQGKNADEAIAIAKYMAADGGHFVAYAAQHLHGGIGIDVDYSLHRYWSWTTQIEHTLGSGRAQIARLGARLAKRGMPAA